MFRAFLDWLRSLFWSTTLDVACIGLQNAGKVRAPSPPLRCVDVAEVGGLTADPLNSLGRPRSSMCSLTTSLASR